MYALLTEKCPLLSKCHAGVSLGSPLGALIFMINSASSGQKTSLIKPHSTVRHPAIRDHPRSYPWTAPATLNLQRRFLQNPIIREPHSKYFVDRLEYCLGISLQTCTFPSVDFTSSCLSTCHALLTKSQHFCELHNCVQCSPQIYVLHSSQPQPVASLHGRIG